MNKKFLLLLSLLLSSTPYLTVRGVPQVPEDDCCCEMAGFEKIGEDNWDEIYEEMVDFACMMVNKLTIMEERQRQLDERVSKLEKGVK